MTTDPRNPTVVADALAFIRRRPHVFLLARRADGFPTAYPMLSKVRGGAVDFSTYRSSAKVTNLLRDGVAAILAVSEVPDDDRVAFAQGVVTVLDGTHWLDDDDDEAGEAFASGAPGFLASVPKVVAATVSARHDGGKRCVLRVTIEQARFSKRTG